MQKTKIFLTTLLFFMISLSIKGQTYQLIAHKRVVKKENHYYKEDLKKVCKVILHTELDININSVLPIWVSHFMIVEDTYTNLTLMSIQKKESTFVYKFLSPNTKEYYRAFFCYEDKADKVFYKLEYVDKGMLCALVTSFKTI